VTWSDSMGWHAETVQRELRLRSTVSSLHSDAPCLQRPFSPATSLTLANGDWLRDDAENRTIAVSPAIGGGPI
jgi:hypothetical protein